MLGEHLEKNDLLREGASSVAYVMRAGVLYFGLFLGAPRETRQLEP